MRIILLTHKGFFTQSLPDFKNVEIEKIFSQLTYLGYECELLEYNDLAKFDYLIDDQAIYWIGSHQNPTVIRFIKDVLFARFHNRRNIVPSIETILCHENKGLMGLIASERSLEFVKQNYCCDTRISLHEQVAVFKKTTGAGSSGVSRIDKSRNNLGKFYRNAIQISTIDGLINISKNSLRKIINRKTQAKYNELHSAHVIQDFVANLDSDYKVLVFMDTIFCLKRLIRNNDFRASGSGKFSFPDEVPLELLKFALEMRKKIDTPYCSLDIIEQPTGNYSLIEFQTVHFGAYTAIHAPHAFKKLGDQYIKKQNMCQYEHMLCTALHEYVIDQMSSDVAQQ